MGDHIQLLSYRVDAGESSADDEVRVTLFWQSDGEVSNSYHVFVHLVSERGRLVAQHDGIPMWGGCQPGAGGRGRSYRMNTH